MKAYMSLPICNDALKDGRGFVRDLNMSAQDIRSLELQGLIKNAISTEGDTWSLTKKGRRLRAFFLEEEKHTVWTRFINFFYQYILRLKIII